MPPNVLRLIRNGDPVPSSFSEAEKTAFAGVDAFYKKGFGYAEMMNTRPQTLGYALADSPVGMAAFFYDKFAAWTYSGGEPERALTRDEMLDDLTLYWVTNTGTSSSRSYWDAAQLGGGPFNAFDIKTVPVAVTIFPGEIYRAPRSWAEQAFTNSFTGTRSTRAGTSPRGRSRLFAAEVRAAFRSLRCSTRRRANTLHDTDHHVVITGSNCEDGNRDDDSNTHASGEGSRSPWWHRPVAYLLTGDPKVVTGGFLWGMKGMDIDEPPLAMTSDFKRQRTRTEPFGIRLAHDLPAGLAS